MATTIESVLPRRRSRWLSRLGTLLVVAGMAVIAWAFVVWQWSDPFTSLYTRWEQRELSSELTELKKSWPKPPPRAGERPWTIAVRIRTDAARLRKEAQQGDAIGRLRVPRLDVNMVLVEGTDSGSLKRGPGRDPRTFMPGEGKLVYVAGHRTTYGAPFAKIDKLRPGDRVTVEMPYGTFVYAVSGHRIVDDQDLSVLRSGSSEEIALQACHPRFFASQRYIVWAKPVRSAGFRGRRYALPTGDGSS